MATQDHELINNLITMYRELNSRIRRLPEERLQLESKEGDSLRETVTRLRDTELKFSQSLKDSISGMAMPDLGDGTTTSPVLGTESTSDTTAIILSQFGTARESTLAMVRQLSDEDWDRKTGTSGATIRSRIEEQVDRDKTMMEEIVGLLGAP